MTKLNKLDRVLKKFSEELLVAAKEVSEPVTPLDFKILEENITGAIKNISRKIDDLESKVILMSRMSASTKATIDYWTKKRIEEQTTAVGSNPERTIK